MIAVIYQSYLAREENKLMLIQQSATVLPYLDSWYSNIGNEYKFVIENKGVGPAFIKDVKFIGIDTNQDTLTFNSSHKLLEFIDKQSKVFDSISVTKSSFKTNMLLSPNEEIAYYIFSFDSENNKRRFRKEFYKFYAGFKITYEDVYGAVWILDTEKGYPEKLNIE